MSTEMTRRALLIKITCGAEAAERANQAWTVAAMGVAAGASVSVWLTGEAVWFAVPGRQPSSVVVIVSFVDGTAATAGSASASATAAMS